MRSAWLAPMSVVAACLPSAPALAQSARVTLPVAVDAVPPAPAMTTVDEGALFGEQPARFLSLAKLAAPLAVQTKRWDISLAPDETLIEYHARAGKQDFTVYCTTRPAKPLSALMCLADRDGDGAFEQLWSGVVTNPLMPVPYPDIRHEADFAPVRYTRQEDVTARAFTIGFVGYGGNVWTGQREFFVQVRHDAARVVLFGSRKTGAAKKGPADIPLFDALVRLHGGTRKQLQVSVERGLNADKYELSEEYPTRQVMIFVPR